MYCTRTTHTSKTKAAKKLTLKMNDFFVHELLVMREGRAETKNVLERIKCVMLERTAFP